jgi:exonuclease VII small subunit
MPTKKTLQNLIEKVESTVEKVDSVETSLEDTLSAYQKTIGHTKDIVDLLNKQKDKFTVLQKQANELLEK